LTAAIVALPVFVYLVAELTTTVLGPTTGRGVVVVGEAVLPDVVVAVKLPTENTVPWTVIVVPATEVTLPVANTSFFGIVTVGSDPDGGVRKPPVPLKRKPPPGTEPVVGRPVRPVQVALVAASIATAVASTAPLAPLVPVTVTHDPLVTSTRAAARVAVMAVLAVTLTVV
jgi:hypothetical protein